MAAPERQNGQSADILVVDDVQVSLGFLVDLLTENGYRARGAISGAQALEALAVKVPDLVLLDVMMPDMDGVELCQRIKSEERTKDVPVLFISGLDETLRKVEGFDAGAVDYIVKPFEPEEILVRVRTHLRLRQLTDHLEKEVRARTLELTTSNERLRQEIAERERAEDRIERLNQCVLHLGSDISANLDALTALCGKLLGGTYAVYCRMEEDHLRVEGRWQVPADYEPPNDAGDRLCCRLIRQEDEAFAVVRDLPASVFAKRDPNVLRHGLQTCIGHVVLRGKQRVGALCVMYQEDVEPTEGDLRFLGIIATAVGAQEERWEAEEQHQTHLRFLEALEQVERVICQTSDPKQMLHSLMKAALTTFSADRAWLLYPCDPDAPTFRVPVEVTGPGYPGAFAMDCDLPMKPGGDKVCAEALAAEGAIRYGPGYEEVSERLLEQYGVQSQMIMALRPRIGKPWMFGIHRCSCTRLWPDEERRLFEEMGRRITDGLGSMLFLQELQASESRFRLLVETAATVILGLSLDYTVTEFNPEAERLYGCTRAEALGQDYLARFLPEDARQEVVKDIQKVLAGRPSRGFENPILRRDGEQRIVSWSVSRLMGTAGEPTGVMAVGQDVTERKRAEEALRESEEKYRSLVENMPLGVAIHTHDGEILYVNQATSDMLGYACPADLVGADVTMLIHPEDAEKVAGRIRRMVETGVAAPFEEERLLRKDGSVLAGEIGGSPIVYMGEPAIQVVTWDITERKQAEEALRRSEEKYRDLVQNANSIILRMDTEGRVTFFNEFAQRFFGFDEEEMLGQNVVGTIVPETENSGRDLRKMILDIGRETERYAANENENMRRNGERVWITWTNKAIRDEAGNVTEVLCVGSDATERRRAEEEAAIRQEQLVQADRLALLGTLVAGVAHEINNPNTFIMMNAHLFLQAWPGMALVLDEYLKTNDNFAIGGLPYSEFRDRAPGMLSSILEGSERIKTIVQELREYARRDPAEAFSPVDVNKAVQAAVNLLGSLIKKSTKRFAMHLSEDLPLVQGNLQRLEQVVLNVLQNACQALPEEDHGILVLTRHDAESDSVCIVVKDEGQGIPTEALTHITDPFFTTKRESGGTGLGLAISSTIVQEHAGMLEVTSQPGEGTSVTVRLPANPSSPTPRRGETPGEGKAAGADTESGR